MDWFLYDRNLRYERVERFAFYSDVSYINPFRPQSFQLFHSSQCSVVVAS